MRTKLHRSLGNGVKAEELDTALAALLAAGKVERRLAATATKPAEQWRAATPTTAERLIFHEPFPTTPSAPNGAGSPTDWEAA